MKKPLPVVFLPGLLCDKELWVHQVQALEGLITPFHPEFAQYDEIGAAAKAILDQAPPVFSLVAQSMGGYISFEIYRQAPERVKKLCLMNTMARADKPAEREERLRRIRISQQGEFQGVTPRVFPHLVHEERAQDKALAQEIMVMAKRLGRDTFINQQRLILSRPDSRPDLPQIKAQTYLIAGDGDKLTPPSELREAARLIPHARFAMLKKCGHMSPFERPAEVSGLLKVWLSEEG